MIFPVLLALALLSALHPTAGLFAGMVFGFFQPGFSLLKRLKVETEGHFFIALSVLLSVLLSTHAVYWVSRLMGYTPWSIALSFGILALLSYRADSGFPKTDWKPLAAAFGFFVVMFALFSNTLWVPTEQGVIVGGWNWSDLFAHLPIIQSVNQGNFPPQTPFFAGEPLNYHWFADFHTAFLAKVSGTEPIPWIRFENALYNALLVLCTFAFASRFLSSKAAWMAVVLFLLGGSFAYVNFFQDFAENPSFELIQQKPYDNDWKGFQVPSLLGGYLIVQRPQMIGIPVLIAALVLLLDGRHRKRNALCAGLLVGLLTPFQYFAFAAALMLCGLLFLYDIWKSRKIPLQTIGLFFLPLLFAVPFVLSALGVGKSAGFLKFTPLWLAPKDPAGFVLFYVMNFGLVALLAMAALGLTKIRDKALLALFALALFLVPNVLTLSGTQWDMTKFFAYMTLPLSVLAAAFLSGKPKVLQGLAVFLCILTPVLLFAWTFQSTWIGLTNAELSAGNWIEKNVPQKAVFAAAPVHNTPIDAVAGRFRLTGYPSWMGNYGLDFGPRENALNRAYCGTPAESLSVLRTWNVSYAYVGPNEKAKYACAYPFGNDGAFGKVYDVQEIQIFRVD